MQMIEDARLEGQIVYQKDLAKEMGMTKSAFTNKLRRESFTIHDLICVAKHFGMKVTVTGNGKTYVIEKGD